MKILARITAALVFCWMAFLLFHARQICLSLLSVIDGCLQQGVKGRGGVTFPAFLLLAVLIFLFSFSNVRIKTP